MGTKALAALGALAISLALAACGSSGSSSTSAGVTDTTATDSVAGTTTTDTTSGDASSFCDNVKSLQSLDSTFHSLAPSDIEGGKTAFQNADDALQQTADSAPPEIKDDADAVASGFDTINGKVQDLNSPADASGLGAEIGPLVASMQQHLQVLQDYTQKNC